MFQHLGNCHGEWNLLFALLGSSSLFGAWILDRCGSSGKNEKSRHKGDSSVGDGLSD